MSNLINGEQDNDLLTTRAKSKGALAASGYLAAVSRRTIRKTLEVATNDEKFDFWYPNWDTWHFRRTLSYWVSVMFLEGSLLFCIGGIFSMMPESLMTKGNTQALELTPYLVGGMAYTLGSYAGVLEVLNVRNKDDGLADYCFKGTKHYWDMRNYLGWEPIAGYFAYMFGAVLYDVNCILGYNTNLGPY